jgi:hypothetical protein
VFPSRTLRNTVLSVVLTLLASIGGFVLGAGMRGSAIFTDVPEGAYYDEAVGELQAAGIVRGYEDGRFGPNDYVTRAQVAVMLQRLREELLGTGIRSARRGERQEVAAIPSSPSPRGETVTQERPSNPAGQIQFTLSTFSVGEEEGRVTISVIRAGGKEGSVSVAYTLVGGTATEGEDYLLTSGVLNFAEGEASKTFSVRVVNDTQAEAEEALELHLEKPTGGASLGTPSVAVLTIEDDDGGAATSSPSATAVLSTEERSAAGSVAFSALEYSMTEAVNSLTITVLRSGGSAGAVTVQYATRDGTAQAPSDYAAASGVLNFAEGEVSKTFTLSLQNDGAIEGKETLSLVLSGPTGGASLGTPSTASLHLVDDEVLPFGVGSLRFGESSYEVLESRGGVLLTVERVGGAQGEVTVTYTSSDGSAKAGIDYTAVSGTLPFLAGESVKSLLIPILNDTANDPDERFTVTLSNPTGGAVLTGPDKAEVQIQE